MDQRAVHLNRIIKSHDRDLFVERSRRGTLILKRKAEVSDVYEVDGCTLIHNRQKPQVVFHLTDNWTATGKPVDWGADAVIERLREHDTWHNPDFFRKFEEQSERARASRKRHLRSEAEAFFSDYRREFARQTEGVMTHSLDKSGVTKGLKRRIRNGNY